jgi:hypothetical protein
LSTATTTMSSSTDARADAKGGWQVAEGGARCVAENKVVGEVEAGGASSGDVVRVRKVKLRGPWRSNEMVACE